MNGIIFNIQKFCVNDGPGIRTTVFLKGCPLWCDWCHNPESQSVNPEFMFYKDKCIGCGRCTGVTASDRDFVCINDAKKICGREIAAEEVVAEVLKDKIFYENSGGGMTLSGGEPLLQYEFSLEILKEAKKKGIHTAVETCGCTDKSLEPISRYVDLWLYDIKIFDAEMHKKYTGVSNKTILENLEYLNGIGAEIILRCPIIPQINMSNAHFEKIASISNRLKSVKAIHIEPYHPLGISKSEQLGKEQKYKNREFLEKEKLFGFARDLENNVSTEIVIL